MYMLCICADNHVYILVDQGIDSSSNYVWIMDLVIFYHFHPESSRERTPKARRWDITVYRESLTLRGLCRRRETEVSRTVHRESRNWSWRTEDLILGWWPAFPWIHPRYEILESNKTSSSKIRPRSLMWQFSYHLPWAHRSTYHAGCPHTFLPPWP